MIPKEVPRLDDLAHQSERELLDLEDEFRIIDRGPSTLIQGQDKPETVQRMDGNDGSDEELRYNGNRAPSEFYRENMNKLVIKDFKGKRYAAGTLL